MIKITMPRLSVAMKTGTIGKWYKKEGEAVTQGEVLLVVETEKVTNDIVAPVLGVVSKILVPEGSEVSVGELLAIVTEPGEEPPSIEEIQKPEVAGAVQIEIRVSPLARRLAEENKIDLAKIKGTGPEGQISKEDVLRAIEEKGAPPPISGSNQLEVSEVVVMTPTRKTIAERLAQSYREAVHVTITMDVDMTGTKQFRERLLAQTKEPENPVISYTDLLVKAAALAIRRNLMVNSKLEGDKIRIFKDINIGVAVATDEGLIVPVIRKADEKSLVEISSSLKTLGEKARTHTLSMSDITGGTFTVSNLGMFNVDTFSPIINPPQSSILGVGAMKSKPVAVEGGITVRPLITLSLVFDHRIIDGAPAAVFLGTIKEILENPSKNMKT